LPTASTPAPARDPATASGPEGRVADPSSGPERSGRSLVVLTPRPPARRASQPLVELDVHPEVVRLAVALDAAIEAEAFGPGLTVEPRPARIAFASEDLAAERKAVDAELEIDVDRVLGLHPLR